MKRHNNDVPHDALQDVNQVERLGVNRSETSRQHRERLQVDSFKVVMSTVGPPYNMFHYNVNSGILLYLKICEASLTVLETIP